MNGMNGDFNPTFGTEIEQKLRTPAITQLPSPEPYLTKKQMEYIASRPVNEQEFTRAIFMAISVPDQKLDWMAEKLTHLNGMQREREREELSSRSKIGSVSLWLLQSIATALLLAAAAWVFGVHPTH